MVRFSISFSPFGGEHRGGVLIGQRDVVQVPTSKSEQIPSYGLGGSAVLLLFLTDSVKLHNLALSTPITFNKLLSIIRW